jgi:hypothetical protein
VLALAAGALASGFFGLTIGAIGPRLWDVLVCNVSPAPLVRLTAVDVPGQAVAERNAGSDRRSSIVPIAV